MTLVNVKGKEIHEGQNHPDPGNGGRHCASYKVMEKVGMVREGTFREEFYWQGRWVNQLFYSLLDSEYQKMRS